MSRRFLRSSSRKLFAAVMLALLAPPVGSGSAPPDPVINEFVFNHTGVDTQEYVEIFGAPATTYGTLTLLQIEGDGSGAGTIDSVIAVGVTNAQGYWFTGFLTNEFENGTLTLLLVETFTGSLGADLDTNNDGVLDSTPWTRIVDDVAVTDGGAGDRTYSTVVLSPNYDGQPFTPGGASRIPNGVDTGSVADWMRNDFDGAGLQGFTGTPDAGEALNTPEATNQAVAPTVVVINEIDYDQPGTDTAEFVELKNIGSVTANLAEFSLQLINGAGGGAVVYDTIPLSPVLLPPGGYFVVCANAATVPNCDLDDDPDTNFIQNGAPDAVALYRGTTLVDTVSYEGNTSPPFTEGSGLGLEDDPSFGDMGISRCPDGADTDQNNVDFSFRAITPGAANSCGVTPAAKVVINEIDYDQPGTDTAEFIELKNTGSASVDLSGFSLQLVNGTGGGAAVYQTIPLPAVSLAPGGYFVVCANAATVFGCDLDVTPDVNLIQNGAPDAVALFFGATLVDTVSYEGNTGAPYTEGSGAGLEDPGGPLDLFLGISRFPDGVDTDQNNIDFSPRCVTPGAANTAASAGCADPAPPVVVINEIDYDQPGFDTAEFIELKNAGSGSVSLDGFTLELVNGSGGGAAVYGTIALPAVTLAPGAYFVVCGDASQVANCSLDVTPDSNLIQNGAPDAVGLRLNGVLIDAVSYEGDTGAPYTEGSGVGLEDPGSSLDLFLGISRFPDGLDTGQNNVDLRTACITPGRANTSIGAGCTATGPGLEIFQIQGSGLASPFTGQTVTTLGNVVTAVGTDGFFIQTPAARSDGDVDTSDGIFVFTGGAPAVAAGDLVSVTGQVVEFFSFTEIGGVPDVVVTGSGAAPAPVVFDAATPSPDPTAPSCALEFECYEGMLVQIVGGTVGGPNQRFGTDPIAEVHIVAGPQRPFREKGILFPGLSGLPVWDGNPEVFELDPDRLGLPNQIIPAGSTFDAVGVIGFEFGGYELWPTELTFTLATLPRPVRPRAASESTIGTLNLLRLFDATSDGGEQVVSATEYARRLAKHSRYVREVLRSPDILAVQEAEKLGVLQDLADRIAADDPTVTYTPYLIEGNDVGGIDVGFLTRETVQVDAVTQLGAAETLTVDGSPLHDRPPLLLEGSFVEGGVPFAIAVMVVHNRSLGGIDSPVDGPRVRQKRLEQAQSIAQKVQDLQTADPSRRLVVLGDFNAFEFTDGYVNVLGQVRGDVNAAENLLSGPDLVDPNLTNQVESLPAGERYSFVFQGNAQALDHVLTTRALDPLVRGVAYGRGNADAAANLINDDSTPLRSSDHDGLVLFIVRDGDGDGIPDDKDACPGTVVPEAVPTVRLGVNRYALVDGDAIFDTNPPPGGVPRTFSLSDTAGCSCEQIIDRRLLGDGHRKFGCSLGEMRAWIAGLKP